MGSDPYTLEELRAMERPRRVDNEGAGSRVTVLYEHDPLRLFDTAKEAAEEREKLRAQLNAKRRDGWEVVRSGELARLRAEVERLRKNEDDAVQQLRLLGQWGAQVRAELAPLRKLAEAVPELLRWLRVEWEMPAHHPPIAKVVAALDVLAEWEAGR